MTQERVLVDFENATQDVEHEGIKYEISVERKSPIDIKDKLTEKDVADLYEARKLCKSILEIVTKRLCGSIMINFKYRTALQIFGGKNSTAWDREAAQDPQDVAIVVDSQAHTPYLDLSYESDFTDEEVAEILFLREDAKQVMFTSSRGYKLNPSIMVKSEKFKEKQKLAKQATDIIRKVLKDKEGICVYDVFQCIAYGSTTYKLPMKDFIGARPRKRKANAKKT